ncbi:hypothetical protein AB0C52_12740 [Streptomyces sp. NPDC048717]|uniref:hypothetical protein n=1 Tax=Streptomyces sp. NPDC048717 TaxID=3154928 RepID=UPI003424E688
MSITLYLPTVDELTAVCGPLRTVLADSGPVDIPPERADVYSFEIRGGHTLRESVIDNATGPALIIRLLDYRDPVAGDRRYAVEKWSAAGSRVVDHCARIVCDVEYERQARAEFAAPSLPVRSDWFTGGLAAFYSKTDVL